MKMKSTSLETFASAISAAMSVTDLDTCEVLLNGLSRISTDMDDELWDEYSRPATVLVSAAFDRLARARADSGESEGHNLPCSLCWSGTGR
jgi:hypothetical protein